MEDFEEDILLDEDQISEGKQEESDHDHSGLDDDDSLSEFRPTSQKLKRSQSYVILPQQEIVKESNQIIHETMQLCNLPTTAAASALLRTYKWNKEHLIEAYLDNPEKTFEKSGISKFEFEQPKPDSEGGQFECLICMETLPAAKTFALACSHRYCTDCWKEYLEIKVKDGPSCVAARCPSPKCKAIVHDSVYKTLVDQKSYERYNHYFTRSFVENNDYVKWCPAPGCSFAVRTESAHRKKPIQCLCGFKFCFQCSDTEVGDHAPAPCEQVRKWKKKANDESENVKWMLQNTKKCPKCRSPIEKNGGCMHMTCRNASCAFEFCWLCRGPWTEHGQATGGYYQCNKYDPTTEKKVYGDKLADGKTELETYMFYFHRYESHKNALKIAADQRNQCNQRTEQLMDKFGVRSADTKFLGEATEQLIANRRVLQFSYVMGYYLDKTKPAEKNLFEYLQEDLEKHTNDLSAIFEQGFHKVSNYQEFIRWKESVANKTRVTGKFLENFLNGVAEGLLSYH